MWVWVWVWVWVRGRERERERGGWKRCGMCGSAGGVGERVGWPFVIGVDLLALWGKTVVQQTEC